MGLIEQLAAYKEEFARNAPPGRVDLYEAKIAELRAEFAKRSGIGAGDMAPDFTLPDADGRQMALTTLLEDGPVVLVFYRGGWCPYCNLQLRAYQAALPEMAEFGARLVAVSPELPDNTLVTSKANALSFPVLSDVGNHVAQAYGLVYTLPVEIQDALRSSNKILPSYNGDDSWQLPIPASFVIGADKTIGAAYHDVDYRSRPSPETILSALRALADG